MFLLIHLRGGKADSMRASEIFSYLFYGSREEEITDAFKKFDFLKERVTFVGGTGHIAQKSWHFTEGTLFKVYEENSQILVLHLDGIRSARRRMGREV